MKISKRLKSLAGLITLDDKVADIGCDHALLDIYMVCLLYTSDAADD